MDAYSIFDQLFLERSHLSDTVDEFLTFHTQYLSFESSLQISNVEVFPKETTVLMHTLSLSQPFLSVPIRPRSRSHLSPPSPTETETSEDPSPTLLPMSQHPMQAVQDELIDLSPTAWKLGRPLQM